MPVLGIGFLSAFGPLLRGAWDLWAQTLAFGLCVILAALWLCARAANGYLPLPPRKILLWSGTLAAVSGLAALLSPVRFYSVPAWRSLALGLAVFPCLSLVPRSGRERLDQAVRACAWLAAALAFYQHYRQGQASPTGPFPNQNLMAGAVLLWLAAAWETADWLLAAALLLILFWDRSVGAWLSLAAALALGRKNIPKAVLAAGAVVAVFALGALALKLQTPAAVHRWQWWSAAVRMIRDKPLLGYGPGSFAYVFPAYRAPGDPLGSLYAHNYFLEIAAGCGALYALLWTAGILALWPRASAPKRFAIAALLIQSLWDYPLCIPGIFWLFCLFAADGVPEPSRGLNIPGRWKIPAVATILALAWGLDSRAWAAFRADQWKARAVAAAKSGASPDEVRALLRHSERAAPDPEAEELKAELDLAAAPGPRLSPEVSARALGALKKAAALNPYRCETWGLMIRLEKASGASAAAAADYRRALAFCPRLTENRGGAP